MEKLIKLFEQSIKSQMSFTIDRIDLDSEDLDYYFYIEIYDNNNNILAELKYDQTKDNLFEITIRMFNNRIVPSLDYSEVMESIDDLNKEEILIDFIREV